MKKEGIHFYYVESKEFKFKHLQLERPKIAHLDNDDMFNDE